MHFAHGIQEVRGSFPPTTPPILRPTLRRFWKGLRGNLLPLMRPIIDLHAVSDRGLFRVARELGK